MGILRFGERHARQKSAQRHRQSQRTGNPGGAQAEKDGGEEENFLVAQQDNMAPEEREGVVSDKQDQSHQHQSPAQRNEDGEGDGGGGSSERGNHSHHRHDAQILEKQDT